MILPIQTKNPYEVVIEGGALSGVAKAVQGGPRTVCLVSDRTVYGLYGEVAEERLREEGHRAVRFIVEPGEESKSLETYGALLGHLAKEGLTRSDLLIALGGGVVGDLCGFAAATYLRGISFVQAPTTLLSMVDASVGGKTAVNIEAGKNLVGAFWQPSKVLIDVDTLKTLPKQQFLSGMAEVVKTAVIGGGELYGMLSSGRFQMEELIARCIEVKASLVKGDERDKGKRQILNLGHSFGHAIEKLSGYQMPHGLAVSAGLAMIARAAFHLGVCDGQSAGATLRLLKQYDLPMDAQYSAEQIAEAALMDKKRGGDTITLIMPRGIGDCILYPVPVRDLPKIALLGRKGI